MSYNFFVCRCQPAYVKYSFFGQAPHRSMGRAQDGSIYWDDINVVLTGNYYYYRYMIYSDLH